MPSNDKLNALMHQKWKRHEKYEISLKLANACKVASIAKWIALGRHEN